MTSTEKIRKINTIKVKNVRENLIRLLKIDKTSDESLKQPVKSP